MKLSQAVKRALHMLTSFGRAARKATGGRRAPSAPARIFISPF